MNKLTDYITYFAQFPPQEVVLDGFRNQRSNLSDAAKTIYYNMKTDVEGLETHSLQPRLQGFFLGYDEEDVEGKLNKMKAKSPFLLLEFPYTSMEGESDALQPVEEAGLSVLHDCGNSTKDMFEEVAILALCEEIMDGIIDRMLEDSESCPLWADLQIDSIVKVPGKIAGCVGFALKFTNLAPWS